MTCKHDAIQTWRTDDGTPVMWSCVDCSRKFAPLIVPAAQTHTSVHPEYTPQRKWQGLTDEDVNRESAMIAQKMKLAFHAGMYVAQQVLKEKNT